jgi:protease I
MKKFRQMPLLYFFILVFMEGKNATCYRTVKGELKNAGVDYKNKALVRDCNLITSRNPDDLPEFSNAIHQALVN